MKYSDKLTNEAILELCVAPQIFKVMHDAPIHNLSETYLDNIGTADYRIDFENEIFEATKRELIQLIDNTVFKALDKAVVLTAAIVDLKFPADSVSMQLFDNFILEKVKDFNQPVILATPTAISTMQCSTKLVYSPAAVGQFRGPNNTMLVGHLLMGKLEVPVISYIPSTRFGEPSKDGIYLLNKFDNTFEIPKKIVGGDKKITFEVQSIITGPVYKLEIKSYD